MRYDDLQLHLIHLSLIALSYNFIFAPIVIRLRSFHNLYVPLNPRRRPLLAQAPSLAAIISLSLLPLPHSIQITTSASGCYRLWCLRSIGFGLGLPSFAYYPPLPSKHGRRATVYLYSMSNFSIVYL
jgi:hypothetical protein